MNVYSKVESSHPCFKELPLYCRGISNPDKGHWRCLGEKMNLLSSTCKDFMKTIYLKSNDCGQEIFTFCVGKKQNYGKWFSCLKERKRELKNKCSVMITNLDNRARLRKTSEEVCSSDAKKYCSGKLFTDYDCFQLVSNKKENELGTQCFDILKKVKATY